MVSLGRRSPDVPGYETDALRTPSIDRASGPGWLLAQPRSTLHPTESVRPGRTITVTGTMGPLPRSTSWLSSSCRAPAMFQRALRLNPWTGLA